MLGLTRRGARLLGAYLQCRRAASNSARPSIYPALGARPYCGGGGEKKSAARHSYDEETETAVNGQIQAELNAAYAYLAFAAHFGRTDVALPGCFGYFVLMHEEEMEHAMMFIKYQNLRGGSVKLLPLSNLECAEMSMEKALEVGMEMEKVVKEKLLAVHDVACKHKDVGLCDWLSSNFIQKQDESIREFGRWLFMLRNARGKNGDGLAEFLVDREMHKAHVKIAADKKVVDCNMATYK